MDQLDRFGFIPNGGRIYYLDRSQPPLFIHMLDKYVKATNDTSILERALPLARRELDWWSNNRTISVTSSYTSKTYNMSHYAVVNSAPRPESYLVDYQTATGANLTEQQRSDLYAELATGAESGNHLTRIRNPGEPFSDLAVCSHQVGITLVDGSRNLWLETRQISFPSLGH